jgi:preprotein translocase subunit SecG
MTILISVLLIVEVLAAFLLIVVILAQKSKDQGLGMAFGGGMGESLFGSRAGNVLTRMTITLTVVFMATTILLGILFARAGAAAAP